MSIEAVKQAYSIEGLPSSLKFILVTLAWHLNSETGQCNPSVTMLMQETGLNRATIIKSLAKAKSLNLIDIEKVSGITNCYKCLFLTSIKNATAKIDTSIKNDTSSEKDTSINFDTSTSINFDTTTSINFDTGPVSILIPKRNIKESKKEREKNSLSSNAPTPPHDTSLTPSNSHEDATDSGEDLSDGQSLTKKGKERKKGIYSEDFERFWIAYPRKVGKGDAWKAWQACIDRPSVDDLIERVRRVAETPQWNRDNGQFIPHPSTWIRQRRFEDEACLPKPKKRFVSAFDRDYGEWQAEMLQLLSLRDDTMSLDATERIAAVIEIDALEEDLRKRGCPYV